MAVVADNFLLVIAGMAATAIVIVIGCLAIQHAFLSYFAKRPGSRGERKVASILAHLPKNEYDVYGDLILLSSRGDNTQIDHVVFSRFGIFVIETKDYSGWIYGKEGDRTWTQVFPRGARKSDKYLFQNPFRQNYKHIKALQELTQLPDAVFHNIVVFVGKAKFKTPPIKNVVPPNQLLKRIGEFQCPMLSKEDVDSAAVSVMEHTNHGGQFVKTTRY